MDRFQRRETLRFDFLSVTAGIHALLQDATMLLVVEEETLIKDL